MSSTPGIRAKVMLDGVALAGAMPTEIGVRRRELKTVQESGQLERREFLAWQEEGYPYRAWKHEVTLRYAAIRACYDLVEEILSGPGPFELVIWKPVHLTYIGDGARSEFLLPWPVALQYYTGPLELAAAKLAPVVKVGLAGSPLTYAAVDAATYAGTPPAGTVWFLEGPTGLSFKLPEPPAVDAEVKANIIPVLSVLEREESEKRYTSPTREPRDIVLVEA